MKFLAYLKFPRSKPNRALWFRVGKYVVKTADTPDELYQLFRLRYRIFHGKLKATLHPFSLDITPYDSGADHLIVKEGKEVIGTYRLRCSLFSNGYFSATEFDISDFTMKTADKVLLELGRACIDPQKRQGAVILCLFRGILAYAKMVNADYLLGCVSVFGNNPEVAAAIHTYLQTNQLLSTKFSIKPFNEVKDFSKYRGSTKEVEIPPLFSTYLKMGTKVYGEPAFDPVLGCMDFLSILSIPDMDPMYVKKLSS